MKVNWKKIGGIAFKVMSTALDAVNIVERNNSNLGPGEKQDLALDFISSAIRRFGDEKIAKLSENPRVMAASAEVVDAIVKFNNVIAEELEKLK